MVIRDDSPCSSLSKERESTDSLTPYPEENGEYCLTYGVAETTDPEIIPVFNGKELEINRELVGQGLSGISVKHYGGSCLRPVGEPSETEEYLLREDYYFDDEEYNGEDTQKELSKTMSSMIKLCYAPKRRTTELNAESFPEDFWDVPPCMQERINNRNSFWNLHRPELCKLTWAHEYMGEAIITEHLHRHLLNHGPICAAFHEHQDMLSMLNKELDEFDKLKELQNPRNLLPDEKPVGETGKRNRSRPCNPLITISDGINWDDESDLDQNQSLHKSREEFCITIGKPIKVPKLRESRPLDENPLWYPCEEDEDTLYPEYYSDFWRRSTYLSCGETEEYEYVEESENETTPQPVGWVEPDYCAMMTTNT